jgi:hypothetical protein
MKSRRMNRVEWGVQSLYCSIMLLFTYYQMSPTQNLTYSTICKTLILFKVVSFLKVFLSHYMFQPIWPSSGVKTFAE